MNRLVRVSGDSMAPTYRPADLLLTRRVGRDGWLRRAGRVRGAHGGPSRGQVVVLRHGGALVLKRVVGVPGDVVQLEAGRLTVGGRSVDGRPHVRGAVAQTWRVPPGHCFVVGDNAAASDDSRVWAQPFVPADDVVAVVVRRLTRGRRPPAAGAHRAPGW